MQRAIKFRVWDIEHGEMSEVFDLSKKGIIHIPNPEKVVFLQYTGLHDKNGVEIYEGDRVDIYEAINENETVDETGVVIYEPCAFFLEINEDEAIPLRESDSKNLEVIHEEL